MPAALNAVLSVVLILASAVWIGGYVAVAVVAIVSSKTLEPSQRVTFFKRFGRVYLRVAGTALVIMYATGWTLLSQVPWSSELVRITAASAALLLILIAGIIQARNLTKLRMQVLQTPENQQESQALLQTIKRRARAATILRTLIGLITVVLVIEATILLSNVITSA